MSEQMIDRDELLKAIGELEARYMRDEQGKEIRGAHWINRNDIVLILHRWPAEAAEKAEPR